jgi:hypothetical protein
MAEEGKVPSAGVKLEMLRTEVALEKLGIEFARHSWPPPPEPQAPISIRKAA